MQKYLPVFLALLLMACGNGSKKGAGTGERVLTVTIEPQRFFLEQIVGDRFTVNTLVPPGGSPETYAPPPSVMMDLGKSERYFQVGGLGFEDAWSRRLKEINPDVTVVNCSQGIDLMEGHGHHHDEMEGHGHNHGDKEGHADLHEGLDPHVWTSPRAMKPFTRRMLEEVVAIDPGNDALYRANYERLIQLIGRVDSTVQLLLKEDLPSRSFIIYHPALGYFARDYGLHQFSIEFEGKSPSPSQLKELVDIARREKINTVFIQKGFDRKNAEVIASEIGAELFVIDPLAYQWDEEMIRIATILAREADE